MAESVMTELVRRAGREAEFIIDSAATSYEEIGNPPHWGTETKLREVGQSVGSRCEPLGFIQAPSVEMKNQF